jgi:hypothetical protein
MLSTIPEQPGEEHSCHKISARGSKSRRRRQKSTTKTYAYGHMAVLNCEVGENDVLEPGKAFMRFTWKNKTIANGVGHLDRFLPTGLLFRSGWRINEFIRNDNHADVYSLNSKDLRDHGHDAESSLEAHVFLDEYHGNSKNYASRKKSRMCRGGNFLDKFWHNGRHVFIIRVSKEVISFMSRNYEEEFPGLLDQKM